MAEYRMTIPEAKEKQMKSLCEKLKINQTQLVNLSVSLMTWAIEEREKGRDICSVHPVNDDDIKELGMSIISAYVPEASTVAIPAVK